MTEQTQPKLPTQLSLTDVQNAIVIFDAAAERGAFKGAELSSVGAVRDKYAAVYQENAPAPEESENTEGSGTPEGEVETPKEVEKKPAATKAKKTSSKKAKK